MSNRILSLGAALAILAIVPRPGQAASQLHLPWEGLTIAVGKTVSIAMPSGAVITGKAVALDPDALVVNVTRTTNPKACLKGSVRVPRASLRVLQMRTKGTLYRVLCTAGGLAAGFVAGGATAIAIDWNDHHPGPAVGAFLAITAGGTEAGYYAGNSADQRWTLIRIDQEEGSKE
jgi:hypothetical protein